MGRITATTQKTNAVLDTYVEKLYENCDELIRQISKRHKTDPETAEELFQEAVFQIMEKHKTGQFKLQHEKSFYAYFWGAVRNAAQSLYRQTNRQVDVAESSSEEEEVQKPTLESLLDSVSALPHWDMQEILQVMKNWDSSITEVLTVNIIEGYSYKEMLEEDRPPGISARFSDNRGLSNYVRKKMNKLKAHLAQNGFVG